MTDQPSGDARTTISVLTSQLDALRARLGDELSDDELYSAAAITVLLLEVPIRPEKGSRL